MSNSGELKEFECKICKFFDMKEEQDIFKTYDPHVLNQHLQDEHGMNVRDRIKTKRPEIEPLSTDLMQLKQSKPPMRFLLVEKLPDPEIPDEKIYTQDIFLPLYSIVAPKEGESRSIFITQFSYKHFRIQVEMNFSILNRDNYQRYSLPLGYHVTCFDCPFAYDKFISSAVKLAKSGQSQLRAKFDSNELEVLIFRCDQNLCQGTKIMHKDHLLKWFEFTDMDDPEDPEKNYWTWEFYTDDH